MSEEDLGGDPSCWAHLFDEAGEAITGDGGTVIVDLAAARSDSGGAIWSLPHGGDLDANLVRLDAGMEIGSHVNNDVDVLVLVQVGSGELTVDEQVHPVDADHLALIPKGARRSIVAGGAGIAYLSIHRQRSPLGIGRQVNAASDTEEQHS